MGYYNIDNYKPNKKSSEILNRAIKHIKSVTYEVSLRWVFYRLLQDGLYKTKSDYDRFTSLTSRARRANWNGWHPLLLTDETRDIIIHDYHGNPAADVTDDEKVSSLIEAETEQAIYELNDLKEQIENFECSFYYSIDENFLQDYFVCLAFEARAMINQFKKYAPGFSIIPCAGQASIPLRYNAAQYVKSKCNYYNLPSIILYFGDLDNAGGKIFNSFREDIENWTEGKAEVVLCGLTLEQVEAFGNIPENYEKPGDYQWEALSDDQAHEIISMAIKKYHDYSRGDKASDDAREVSAMVRDAVNQNLDTYRNTH